MNKFNKGFIPLIAIIIIAAVVLIGGGGVAYYYASKTKPAVQTQTQQNTQNNKPSITITSPNGGSYTNGQSIVVSYNASGLDLSRQYIAQIIMEVPGGNGPGPNYVAGNSFSLAGPCYTGSCNNIPVINGSNSITLSIPYTLYKASGNYQINFKVIDWTAYLTGVGEGPISVASTTGSGLISVSRSSTFVTPTITITSPNAGAQWVQGSTHNITWTSANLPLNEKVKIMVLDYSDNVSNRQNITIAEGISASQGTYSWTVPANLLGNKFNMQISGPDAAGLQVSGPAAPNATGFLSIVTPTINQTAGWKTYTNSQYGFSLLYPTDFANINDLTTAQQQSLRTYMEVCFRNDNNSNETDFCYIGKQTSDGFAAASLNITPSPSISMQDCEKSEFSESTKTQTQQITINSITFYKNQLTDSGLGHYVSTDSYRTYHGGICYTIDLNIESDRGKSEKGLSADFSSMMRVKLESILSTFKFTN